MFTKNQKKIVSIIPILDIKHESHTLMSNYSVSIQEQKLAKQILGPKCLFADVMQDWHRPVEKANDPRYNSIHYNLYNYLKDDRGAQLTIAYIVLHSRLKGNIPNGYEKRINDDRVLRNAFSTVFDVLLQDMKSKNLSPADAVCEWANRTTLSRGFLYSQSRLNLTDLNSLLARLKECKLSNKSLAFELERTPKISYNELSTRVLPGDTCDVLFHMTGGKSNSIYFLRHPHGNEDVEGLLLRTCKEENMVLSQCHKTLNGKAFHLQKDMQVKDLADDLVKKFPFFKIYR